MKLKTLLLLFVTVSISAALLMMWACRRPPTDPLAESSLTQWRWIGLMEQDTERCPEVPGWKEGPLFPDSKRPEEPKPDRAPWQRPDLARYCVYKTDNAELRFPTKPLPPGLAEAEPDRIAISTTSAGGRPVGTLGQEAWPVWAEQFRRQTLGTGSQEKGGEQIRLKTQTASVRLVFLDTQEAEAPFDLLPGSRHGYTLVHLAQNLVCPGGGPCAAEIRTRLALRYDDFDPSRPLPPPSRGHLGLLTDLAAAIEDEVWQWQRDGSPGHLILNLSLGWDGEPFGDLKAQKVSDLDLSVKAVYDALRYAEESGVLVIAAAGNRRGGSDSTSPLLPAAWDLQRPEECSSGSKLIYAVGGVDSRGLHLANSRRRGRPECAAFADHAVTGVSGASEPTSIYTGTSVSAAVVSSIAAVVWHLRPELQPADLMRLIIRAGNETNSQADYYAENLPKAPRVRRLSLCPAVTKACETGKCSGLEAVPECAWSPTPAEVPTSSSLPVAARRAGLSPPCGPSNPCPTEQFVDQTSHRWVGPQPEEIPCSNCVLRPPPPGAFSSFSSAYALYPELNPVWLSGTGPNLERSVLQIVCGSNPAVTKSYSISVGFLSGSEPIPLDFIDPGDLANCSATLDFKIAGEALSVQNPVYVVP